MAKGGGIEVAQAFVTIIPSLKGSQDTIAKELGAEKIGESSGKKLAASMGKTLAGAGKVMAAGFLAAETIAEGAITTLTVKGMKAYSEYEQLAGGAEQIFSGLDFDRISADAQGAYKTMGKSANEYLAAINQTGAAFKATMGDEAGYSTAKRGMQAISDYASGTGRSVDNLNEKYALITRSTSSYQSIADQFSGILPATSADFLEQAQNAGLLSDEYKKLTDVPIAEYQQAVTAMLEKGVDSLGLTGNTAREAEHTISGSLDMLRSSWANFLTELGKDDADVEARVGELVDSAIAVGENVVPRAAEIVGRITSSAASAIVANGPKVMSAATKILDGVTNGSFSRMVSAVKPYAERISTTAKEMVERFKPLAPVVQDIAGKFGGILLTGLKAATGAFEFIAPIVTKVAEHALPTLSSILGTVGSAFEAALTFMEPVGTFLSDVLCKAIDFAGDGVEGLAGRVEDAFGKIADIAGAMVDFLKDPVGSIGDLAKKMSSSFTGTAKTAEKSASRVKKTGKSYDSLNKDVSKYTAAAAKSAETNMSKASTSITKSTSSAAKSTEKNMASVSKSVSSQGSKAASSAETDSARIEKAWNKTFTTKMNATANTSSAESTMSSFKTKWSGFSVSGSASVSTSGATKTMNDWIYRNNNFVLKGSIQIKNAATNPTKGYMAAGGIVVQRHAEGFIANRRGSGVDITRHIAGEAGAEAVIPLTNRRFVAPFAKTVAEFINDERGGVTITGNTFIVRKDSDIDAIGRSINQQEERQRRSKLGR